MAFCLNTLSFPTYYTFQMFNPTLYSYLQFECIDETLEPSTEETACRQSGSSYWEIFLKPRPFMKQNNAEFTNVSCFTSLHMCSTHFIPFVMILLALPTSSNFVHFVFAQLPGSLPGESCVGPLCAGFFSGNCNSSELDSLGFWTSDTWELATSCRKFLYVISCLCLVFCTQKCIEGHIV